MLQSQLFTKTKRAVPCEAESVSHKLLLRGDFIDQLTSGVFSFLPLGCRVLKKIEKIIRWEMEEIGGQEVFLPSLTPKSLWLETKRWLTIDPPLFKFKDRHQKELALGSTHEEVIVDLVRRRVRSYRDLPFALFQIQAKFRNEMRSSGGLLRTKEFVMKDLYSFHQDEKDLDRYYDKVVEAYKKIYKRCGLDVLMVEAKGGTIGGKTTHEFMVLSEAGEDKVVLCPKNHFAVNLEAANEVTACPKCGGKLETKRSIEVGHIFKLGVEYCSKMKAKFIDQNGEEKLIWAGCYGIGLPRVMATVVEKHHDDFGISWPKEIAPFDLHLICLQPQNKKVNATCEKIYQTLQKEELEVLYDDREIGIGEKLKDADLIGVPNRLVVSERTLLKKAVEYKERSKKESRLVRIKDIQKLF